MTINQRIPWLICFVLFLGHLFDIGTVWVQHTIEEAPAIQEAPSEDGVIYHYRDMYGFAQMWCDDASDTRTFKFYNEEYVETDFDYTKPCPPGGIPVPRGSR